MFKIKIPLIYPPSRATLSADIKTRRRTLSFGDCIQYILCALKIGLFCGFCGSMVPAHWIWRDWGETGRWPDYSTTADTHSPMFFFSKSKSKSQKKALFLLTLT